MWEKIAGFLVAVLTFVSAPFATPEPPVAVEEPLAVVEEVQSEVAPVAEPEQPKPTEPTAAVKGVKTADPYCAQYAFRYSAEKYKAESERPKKEKKKCEKENDREGDNSIRSLSKEYNCVTREKEAKKEFKVWEEKYEEYRAKCAS